MKAESDKLCMMHSSYWFEKSQILKILGAAQRQKRT